MQKTELRIGCDKPKEKTESNRGQRYTNVISHSLIIIYSHIMIGGQANGWRVEVGYCMFRQTGETCTWCDCERSDEFMRQKTVQQPCHYRTNPNSSQSFAWNIL